MKNKLSLVALSVVAAFAASTARADENLTGSVTMNAAASNTCAIGKVISSSGGGGVTQTATAWAEGGAAADPVSGFNDAAGVRTVAFGNLFNATTALLNPGPTTGAAGNMDQFAILSGAQFTVRAYCNYGGAAIKLRSSNGGMRLVNTSGTVIAPPPVAGNFRNALNYSAAAYWGRGSGPGSTTQWVTTGEGTLGSLAGKRFGSDNTAQGDVAGLAWTPNGTSTAARNSVVDVRIIPRNGMTVPAAGYLNPAQRGANDGAAANTVPFLAGTYADTMTMRLGVTF